MWCACVCVCVSSYMQNTHTYTQSSMALILLTVVSPNFQIMNVILESKMLRLLPPLRTLLQQPFCNRGLGTNIYTKYLSEPFHYVSLSKHWLQHQWPNPFGQLSESHLSLLLSFKVIQVKIFCAYVFLLIFPLWSTFLST